MPEFMSSLAPQSYALFRIVAGFLFLWHGVQKLFGFPEGMPPGVPSYIQFVAGPIELVGGVLVMIGLFTRPAAFLCSGLMAFAYWMGHGTQAVLPVVNGGELAALYCFAFLALSANGPGLWSVDAARAATRSGGNVRAVGEV
jgi:putative oxidoreductase